MNLGVRIGQGCARLLDAKMRDLTCENLQFDELWGFIGKKEKHVQQTLTCTITLRQIAFTLGHTIQMMRSIRDATLPFCIFHQLQVLRTPSERPLYRIIEMSKETKPKRGRPALPKGHVKGKHVPVRLTDADLKAFTKAMKKSDHKTLSGWIRHTLREAVTND